MTKQAVFGLSGKTLAAEESNNSRAAGDKGENNEKT